MVRTNVILNNEDLFVRIEALRLLVIRRQEVLVDVEGIPDKVQPSLTILSLQLLVLKQRCSHHAIPSRYVGPSAFTGIMSNNICICSVKEIIFGGTRH